MSLRPADAPFLERLAAALPPGRLARPEARHLSDPRGRVLGQAAALALPQSTAEVATIVTACQGALVGLVPWGGGTGLVLGQIAGEGPAPLLLSLEKMRATRGMWPEENVMALEAGCVLTEAQARAQSVGRLFPLSLASQGSCTIGGVLATNAGGIQVLRYGNARDLCLGLEAVMADGRIWQGLSRLRKDNMGYDLRDLLIGSEGTLAVITAATLRLFPQPAGEGAAFFPVESPEAALQLLAAAGEVLQGQLSAFELIAGQGLTFLRQVLPDLRQPFPTPPPWAVLIGVGTHPGLTPEAALLALAETVEDLPGIGPGLLALSESQRQDFWRLRESLPLAGRQIGSLVNHDISLPLSEIPGFLAEAGAAIAALGPYRINGFGHLGDGNLHYNIFPPEGAPAPEGAGEVLRRLVHDLVAARGGSIAAEHGVGRLKVAELARYGDPVKLAAMRAIKAALDPAGILNPGVLFT